MKKFYPPTETTNPFLTYYDNLNYATLDAYGRNELIITKTEQIYNCSNYLFKFKEYASLDTMLPYINQIQNLKIQIGNNCKIYTKGNTVLSHIVYNNYYKAPWSRKLIENIDLMYFRLCDYDRFKNLASFYYGTNYGEIWSVCSGSYKIYGISRPNKDEMYTLIADTNSPRKQKNITAHWISGYFVHNPKPNKYNTLCHKDNNPSNNYYKNLYWGTQADNLRQAKSDNRIYTKLDKITIEQILMERKEAIENGYINNNIINDYAKKLGVTIQAIYLAIKSFKLEHLFIDYNINNKKKSDTPLVYDNCSLANDYSLLGDYVVLRSFNRKDIILTNTFGIVYKCIENTDIIDEIFKENHQEDWPSLATLSSMNILKRITSSNKLEKYQITRINCKYIDVESLTLKTLYNNYYNYSPWFMQKILNNGLIHYVQMSTHSRFSTLPNYYFLINNGQLFSMYAGLIIKPYTKQKSNIKEYSLMDINKKAITRSVLSLLESFGFR